MTRISCVIPIGKLYASISLRSAISHRRGGLAPVAADVSLHQPFLCQRGHSLVPRSPQSGRVVKVRSLVCGSGGKRSARTQISSGSLIPPQPRGHHIGVFDQFHCLLSCHNWNSAICLMSACFLFRHTHSYRSLTSFIVFLLHFCSAKLIPAPGQVKWTQRQRQYNQAGRSPAMRYMRKDQRNRLFIAPSSPA